MIVIGNKRYKDLLERYEKARKIVLSPQAGLTIACGYYALLEMSVFKRLFFSEEDYDRFNFIIIKG